MWWIILGIVVVITFILWCVLAGSRKEDDYEEQKQAIETWKIKHNKK